MVDPDAAAAEHVVELKTEIAKRPVRQSVRTERARTIGTDQGVVVEDQFKAKRRKIEQRDDHSDHRRGNDRRDRAFPLSILDFGAICCACSFDRLCARS